MTSTPKKHGERRGRQRRVAAHGLLMGAMLLGAQAALSAQSADIISA